jgi:flagellar motor switch protein FliN
MSEPQTDIQEAVEVPAEAVDYVPFEATVGEPAPPREDLAGELERLRDVPVELAVEIGRTRMTIGETLALGPGSILTLSPSTCW